MPIVDFADNSGERICSLTTALLVYEGGREVIVTQHKVVDGQIHPGQPLDVAAFVRLLKRGENAHASGDWAWQFPRLMAESKAWRLWWSPAGIKSVFIGDDGAPARTVRAWIPSLVWCGSRSRQVCYLWAYDGDGAPTEQTDMYRPQFGPEGGLNHIHHDCRICNGTMKLEDNSPASWEKAFWNSRFKVPGNLKRKSPYACKEIFQRVGTLAAILPRGAAAH